MRRLILAAMLAVATAPALAQEPVGCDKFKWPLESERALLAKPTTALSGSDLPGPIGRAVELTLLPFADAKLPQQPQRMPKTTDSRGGFLRAAAPAKAGTYRVTLSQGAWIDVIQAEHKVETAAFSGALGCDGVRKSVKFTLKAEPFIIQLTGSTATHIGVVVTPD